MGKRIPRERERTATPAELQDERQRWIRAREGKRAVEATQDTGKAQGATEAGKAQGTADADRASIRALRKGLKRTANMLAIPSMSELVFGGIGGGAIP